jgi:zinc transport system substrate-binding protein
MVLAGSAAFAAGAKEGPAASSKPVIAVSILPQTYFVERISGGDVSVAVLVGPGQSPHSYEPTPKQMTDLSRAKAWILSNTDFEIALKPKIALLYPSLLIVDGTEGVKFRSMEAHDHEDEDHDEDHKDDHEKDHDKPGSIDRHTWLGREPAKIMAKHVKNTLSKINPSNAAAYEANYKTLIRDIDGEFDSLAPRLASLKGKSVFVFHPAFGYFFDEFGIEQEAVETGGKEPTAKALAALIEKAKKEKVPAIFVQAQFPTNAAKTVAAAVGAEVVPLDSLDPDWLANIRRIGEALKKAVRRVQ